VKPSGGIGLGGGFCGGTKPEQEGEEEVSEEDDTPGTNTGGTSGFSDGDDLGGGVVLRGVGGVASGVD